MSWQWVETGQIVILSEFKNGKFIPGHTIKKYDIRIVGNDFYRLSILNYIAILCFNLGIEYVTLYESVFSKKTKKIVFISERYNNFYFVDQAGVDEEDVQNKSIQLTSLCTLIIPNHTKPDFKLISRPEKSFSISKSNLNIRYIQKIKTGVDEDIKIVTQKIEQKRKRKVTPDEEQKIRESLLLKSDKTLNDKKIPFKKSSLELKSSCIYLGCRTNKDDNCFMILDIENEGGVLCYKVIYIKEGESKHLKGLLDYFPLNDYFLYYEVVRGGHSFPTLIPITQVQFDSLFYNCLPVQHVSTDEKTKFESIKDSKLANYIDVTGTSAFAIDPVGSKDRDDAINFEVNREANTLVMYVYVADATMLINLGVSEYLFNYCFYKQETDYLLGDRYPMIDPLFSEQKLSLGETSETNFALACKITYELVNGKVNTVPLSVELSKVKNLTVIPTTYKEVSDVLTTDEPVHINESTDENRLPVNWDVDGIKYTKTVYSINPEPNKIQVEREHPYYKFYECYKIFVKSLDMCNIIKTSFASQQWSSSGYHFHLKEEWLHHLIEITAVETNKYVAYFMLLGQNFDVNERPLTLSRDEIQGLETILKNKKNYLTSQAISELTQETFSELTPEIQSTLTEGIYRTLPLVELEYKLFGVTVNEVDTQSQFQHYFLGETETVDFDYEYTENLIKQPQRRTAVYTSLVHPQQDLHVLAYTHFTSPLRRVIDLLVHTLLNEKDKNEKVALINLYRTRFIQHNSVNEPALHYNNITAKYNFIKSRGNSINVAGLLKKTDTGVELRKTIYFPAIDLSIPVPKLIKDDSVDVVQGDESDKPDSDYGFYNVRCGDFTSDNFTFSKIYEIEDKKDFLNRFIDDIVDLGFVHRSEVEPFSYTHFYLVSNLLIEINRKDFVKTNIQREDILDLRKTYDELYSVPVVTVEDTEEIKDTEGTKESITDKIDLNDLFESSLPPSAGGYKSKYLEYKKKYLSLK